MLSASVCFLPPPAKRLAEGNRCHPSAAGGFPPPPSRLVWGSSACVWGRGWGRPCCCCVLALVAARRESERARDGAGAGERERERSRDRVSGAAHSAGTALQTHARAEKGGHGRRREPAAEVRLPGVTRGSGERAAGLVPRWVTGCDLP